MIPFYKPSYDYREQEAALKVIESGLLSFGDKIAEFEETFAKKLGFKYAVSTRSCTTAIELCLNKLKPEVVFIPSVTYVSVANAISNSEASLHFVDDIHVGRIYQLGMTNIWDCAHELKKSDDSMALHCFSFYPTKLIGGAEGGMIATDDKPAAEWLRQMKEQGIQGGRKSYNWDYVVDYSGFKANMTNLQAAIALVQLEKLDELNEKRSEILKRYNEAFGLKNKSLHLYPILLEDGEDRELFLRYMEDNGVKCSVHFKPIHLQPAYFSAEVNLPISEHWGRYEVSLPFYAGLTEEEQNKIIKLVKERKNAD